MFKNKLRTVVSIGAAVAAFIVSLWLAALWRTPVTSFSPVANSEQDMILHLEDTETADVPIRMAAGSTTVIEIPPGDSFHVVHPGDNQLITLGKDIFRPDGQFTIHTGPQFPSTTSFSEIPPPESAATDKERAELYRQKVKALNQSWQRFSDAIEQARDPNYKPAPLTQIIAQTNSGATFTISVSPAASVAESTSRVVISYDRDHIAALRKAAGMSVHLKEKDAGSKEKR